MPVPRVRKPGPDYRYVAVRKPVINAPAFPPPPDRTRLIKAAVSAAEMAIGEKTTLDEKRYIRGSALPYAFAALADRFPADPARVARAIGIYRATGFTRRVAVMRTQVGWNVKAFEYVARQLGKAIDQWHKDQDAVTKAAAQAKRDKQKEARDRARERREAELAHFAEEARADHLRRLQKAAEEEAQARVAPIMRVPVLTPRVYTKMRDDTRPGLGLKTARPRDEWWNGDEVRRPAQREVRAVYEIAGSPPAGRSALDMKRKENGM